ncbi:Esterase B1 [Frankliniella fusca]|uniref:Carboxylic ester hydrolase n=1 Tax=Frankliniella fusca TaxID=407009 RepID=A0AAE1LIP1_9NEOP|nr:Esterase B1 [Frankliniella fusca]
MCVQPHTEIYWLPPEIHKMRLPTSWRRLWLIVSSLPRLGAQILRFWRQQEDCLYLNVYTKRISGEGEGEPMARLGCDPETEDPGSAGCADKLSPVIVFIHGGAFYTGTANSHIYGPDYLLREDVVLVTVQYRLGAIGFLAPGSEEVPGNAGLKDQAAALRWVRDNIRVFGGDPGRVTLVGHSAGGASVHYHTLSAVSRGLFHRAVHLSGCALNAWAFATPAAARARARRLADLLGCGRRCAADPDELVAFLRTKTPREIIHASYSVFQHQETAAGYIAPFVPTVDAVYMPSRNSSALHEAPFLRASPEEAMRGADYHPVPTLAGLNSEEGMVVLLPDIITDEMTPSPRNLELLDKDFERVVPVELDLQRGSEKSRLVASMIRQHYFAGKQIGSETVLNYVQIYSDIMFSIGIGRYIRALQAHSSQPTFVYYFSFDGKLSVIKKLVRSELPGVSHGDELGYLFPVEMMPAEDVRPWDIDMLVRDRWTRILANFAKYGSPSGPAFKTDPVLNTTWSPSTATAPTYLNIGAELTQHDGYPKIDAYYFWESVYRIAGRTLG